jgi:phosphoadenosine phosphosulfate reductase
MVSLTPNDSAAMASAPPPEIVAWAVERFRTWRLVITTAFGMEGCALVDMVARAGHALRVTYLDTHFLFAETLALRDRLARRYPNLTFVNAGTHVTPDAQDVAHGPRLWERDPDACCHIRKVEPMQRLLAPADVWFTAIRRDQTPERGSTPVIAWDWRFDVLKVSPLAAWSRADVWNYVREHDVPYNELHDLGYPSIGCTHCTVPIAGATAATYSRSGRWQGRNKTECGLHIPAGGSTP